jgi:hypothetical protein
MKKTIALFVLTSSVLIAGLSAAQAQSIREIIEDYIKPGDVKKPEVYKRNVEVRRIDNTDGVLTRAMNLARQTAEKTNGGLNNYRAEAAMYGPVEKAPFVDNRNRTVTFTFLGGRPALPPTIQSVVTVAVDTGAVTMDYNGPIRP